MVVVGTRPEIIRLSSTIKAIEKYFQLVLVHHTPAYMIYIMPQLIFKISQKVDNKKVKTQRGP